MSVHDPLLDLFNTLGYPFEEGICHGFSLRWLEACLLGKEEQERFEKRLEYIASKPKYELYAALQEVKNKGGNNLTTEDYKLLEILGFYESLAIFHTPSDWSFLVDKRYLTQNDVDTISAVASSDEITKRGGLKSLYSAPLILNEKEIKEYLDKLGQFLDETTDNLKEPIGILLGSHEHTVAIAYKPGEGWNFRDINDEVLTTPIKPITTKQLAAEIRNAFDEDEENSPYTALNAQIILTKLDPRCGVLEERLKEFKKLNPISKDIALRKTDTINLLYIAAQHGHLEEIKALIKEGADLNTATKDNNVTPIWTAADQNHVEIVKVLAEAGAGINYPDKMGKTPLWIASDQGHVAVVEELIRLRASLNQKNINCVTPLWIAAKNGHTEIVNLLIKAGVNLDIIDKNGATALWIAAQNGHTEIVNLLVKAGANLELMNQDDKTPLWIAAQNGHTKIVNLLVNAGAKQELVDENGATPLWIASQKANVASVIRLTQNKNTLNIPDINGVTPAWIAAEQGDAEVIKVLAEAGADLNQADRKGITPLLIAAKKGHHLVVEQLTKYKNKIDLNQVFDGLTPFYIAAQEGRLSVVKALLAANVDVTIPLRRTVAQLKYFASFRRNDELQQRMDSFIKDKADTEEIPVSPSDMAYIMGHQDIVELIRQHGLTQNLSQSIATNPGIISASFFSTKSKCLDSKAPANSNLPSDYKSTTGFDSGI